MKSEIGKYLRCAWWCLWVAVVPVGAQQVRKLSLTEAIEIAKRDSYAAQVARYSFLGQYWNYRSYRGGTAALVEPFGRGDELRPLYRGGPRPGHGAYLLCGQQLALERPDFVRGPEHPVSGRYAVVAVVTRGWTSSTTICRRITRCLSS